MQWACPCSGHAVCGHRPSEGRGVLLPGMRTATDAHHLQLIVHRVCPVGLVCRDVVCRDVVCRDVALPHITRVLPHHLQASSRRSAVRRSHDGTPGAWPPSPRGSWSVLTRTSRGLRTVRTGYAYQPPACGTYRRHRAVGAPRHAHRMHGISASGVPYVPHTVVLTTGRDGGAGCAGSAARPDRRRHVGVRLARPALLGTPTPHRGCNHGPRRLQPRVTPAATMLAAAPLM